MARKLRVEFEGAVYHVMNRGDQRERIFVDDEDRRLFLATLGEACAKTEWQVDAFCLMPVRSYAWSSYPEYLRKPGKRLIWLRVERLLGEWGIGRDAAAGRGRFEQGMERRAEGERAKESGDWKQLRRGWCWGPKTFREERLDRIGERRTRAHEGPEIREAEEQKAERLIGGMLRQAGWKEGELEQRAKGDKRKVRIAERLRGETTMTWEWIAKRLRMGHWRTAFNAARAVSKRKRT